MNRFCGHSEIVTVNYMKIEGPPKSNGLIVAGRAIKRGAKKKFCNGYTCKNFTKYFCVFFSEHSKFFFLFCEKKLHFLAGSLRIILFDVVCLTGSRTYSRPDGKTRERTDILPTTGYGHTTDDRTDKHRRPNIGIRPTTGIGILPTTGRTYF